MINAGEDKIHVAEKDRQEPHTPKQKWQNFWYYHKWHVWIGLAVFLLVCFLVHDFTSKVVPDYEVALLTKHMYTEEQTAALKKKLEQYGKDLNGDGKVIVQINNYVISDDGNADPNVQVAGEVRLTADLSSGQSMIFFTEDESFRSRQKQMNLFAYLDGTTPPQDAVDYDRMRVPIAECKGLSGVDVPQELSVSLRVYDSSSKLGKDEKQAENYKASKELFQKILSA